MVVKPVPIARTESREQPENASSPMAATLSGTIAPVRALQPENAAAPMAVTPLPIVKSDSALHR